MIRQATKFDKTEVTEIMRMFRDEADLPEYKDVENIDYWNYPVLDETNRIATIIKERFNKIQ